METKRIFEARGVIIKEESVKSLESNILENTLVLENTDAFPGYFGKNLPDTSKPRSLFIILDKKYDEFFIARTLKNIGNKMKRNCVSSYGDLFINGTFFYCVRIKNLDCFPSVMAIQKGLTDAGIGLMKYHNTDSQALIRIHKSFLIEPFCEGVFTDLSEPDHYYFNIPSELKWDAFKRITFQVKNNMDNNIFDAALGCIWRIEGLQDVVRIYDKKIDSARITSIRKKYTTEISHFIVL